MTVLGRAAIKLQNENNALIEARDELRAAETRYHSLVSKTFSGRQVFVNWGRNVLGPYRVIDTSGQRLKLQNLDSGKKRWVDIYHVELLP